MHGPLHAKLGATGARCPLACREYACEQNVVIGVLMVPLIAGGCLELTVISNMALSGALGAALRDGD